MFTIFYNYLIINQFKKQKLSFIKVIVFFKNYFNLKKLEIFIIIYLYILQSSLIDYGI